MTILGAFFILVGIIATHGFLRVMLALGVGSVTYGVADLIKLATPWPAVYVVLVLCLVLRQKEKPTVASPEERDKRKALMETQDKLAEDLFKRASSSGEFRRP